MNIIYDLGVVLFVLLVAVIVGAYLFVWWFRIVEPWIFDTRIVIKEALARRDYRKHYARNTIERGHRRASTIR